MAVVRLAATTSKCATCDRWSGARQAIASDGTLARQIEFDNAQTGGECVGGPWDGNVRDPLTRCGRWMAWAAPQ